MTRIVKGGNVKILIVFITVVILAMASCSTVVVVENPMEESIPEYISVRPPTLKYSIIETLYEIYRANVLIPDQIASAYALPIDGYKEHYEWLIKTYEGMDEQTQSSITELFESVHPWTLMNLTTMLSDGSTIGEIVDILTSSEADYEASTKKLIGSLLQRFYKDYFHSYFSESTATFLPLAEKMTTEALKRENILSFIEERSGVSLRDKSVVLYYSLQAVGAWSFDHGDLMISTIQRNVNRFELLYHTPFHEFTHNLYRDFTSTEAFYNLCLELFFRNWTFAAHWYSQPSLYSIYSWWMFCEENLVEGFAKFLRQEFYGDVEHTRLYYYDLDFYKHLREIAFDPSTRTLEEVSIEFLQTVLKK